MHSIPIHRCGWCSKTHLEVWQVSQSNFSSTHLLTTFKGSTFSITSTSSSQSAPSHQSVSSGQSASSSQSASTIQSTDHHLEHSWGSAWGAPCMFTPLFLYGIFPYIIYKTRSPKLYKLAITTSFLHWTVLMLHIWFLPGVLHSRPLTNHLLILSTLLRPCKTMTIMSFLILFCSYTQLLWGNMLSHGSKSMMLGSCAWQKSHLLPYQINLSAHFCWMTTLYQGRGKPMQHIVVNKS